MVTVVMRHRRMSTDLGPDRPQLDLNDTISRFDISARQGENALMPLDIALQVVHRSSDRHALYV